MNYSSGREAAMAEGAAGVINSDKSTTSISSNEDLQRVSIWVNPVPMNFGIISPSVGTKSSLPAKFTFGNLKKLLAYTKSKGKHSYPWLSYSVWRHIAKNKLHMSDELSWLYFETFDTVSDVNVSERLKLLDLLNKCKNAEDLEKIHKQVCVDTVKFILFLYLQNAPRLSLCAPLVTGEEWPSPEHDKKLKSSSDHTHLSFVRAHLHKILQLTSESDEFINIDGVRGLEFILLCSINKESHLPLTSLALLPEESPHNGLLQGTTSFSLVPFETWLRSHLILNPYGPQAMKGGVRDHTCPCYRSDMQGRIVTNIQTALAGVLIHGVMKQTLAKGQLGLESSLISIQNCKSSYIYLIGAMKGVVIDKCSRCVIVLGAVERTVTITNCNELCIVCACRRIQISSTSYSTFHLLTMTRPLLLASNNNLTFAPYNTCYPLLGDHLQRCGLVPTLNIWDSPLSMTTGETTATWSLMDPADFYTMEIPFVMEGPTKVNPTALPVIYNEALDDRKRRIAEWYSTVKEANLVPEKQRELQQAVQDKFKEWLDVTGHKREIYDLGRGVTSAAAAASTKM